MKPFHESMRHDYNLKPTDRVIDGGGYEGSFAKTIAEKYGCFVDIFEPIPQFASQIQERFNGWKNVDLHQAGLGGFSRVETFRVHGYLSGLWSDGESVESPILGVAGVLRWPRFKDGVELFKLNVEGQEFEILEELLKPENEALLLSVGNYQIQFHQVVPNFEERHRAIRSKLLETHELTFEEPWIWSNFCRKQ